MADNKFEGIRKSLSSWSLSTIKKPKISAPKFRKPKINLFSGKKKPTRVEQEDQVAKCDPEVNESLITHSPETSQVIHDPREKDGSIDHPYIIITVHDGSSSDKKENNFDKDESPEKQLKENDIPLGETSSNYQGDKQVQNQQQKGSQDNGVDVDSTEKEEKGEIRFIDDNEEDEEPKKDKGCATALKISPEEYYAWFDAQGSPSAKLKNKEDIESEEDYANYLASEYFDANDSRTTTPLSGKSYEDIEVPPAELAVPGSTKAREWVKSFNDDASKRAEACMKTDMEAQQELPRSHSETELRIVPEKWTKKKEIVLNTDDTQRGKNLFSRMFSNENKKLKERSPKDKEDSSKTKPVSELAKRESIRRVFGVRGKLSLKTSILDSKISSYKETDIYLASTPLALTNTVKTSKRELESNDSVDVSDDGILETSVDEADKAHQENQTVDDTEELLKEIEKYLSDTDSKPKRNSQMDERSTVSTSSVNISSSKEYAPSNSHPNSMTAQPGACPLSTSQALTKIEDPHDFATPPSSDVTVPENVKEPSNNAFPPVEKTLAGVSSTLVSSPKDQKVNTEAIEPSLEPITNATTIPPNIVASPVSSPIDTVLTSKEENDQKTSEMNVSSGNMNKNKIENLNEMSKPETSSYTDLFLKPNISSQQVPLDTSTKEEIESVDLSSTKSNTVNDIKCSETESIIKPIDNNKLLDEKTETVDEKSLPVENVTVISIGSDSRSLPSQPLINKEQIASNENTQNNQENNFLSNTLRSVKDTISGDRAKIKFGFPKNKRTSPKDEIDKTTPPSYVTKKELFVSNTEQKKKQTPTAYFSNTFKNIKENIHVPESLDREKIKKTLKFGQFRRGKKRNSQNDAVEDENNSKVEGQLLDETINSIDESALDSSFIQEDDEDTDQMKERRRENVNTVVSNDHKFRSETKITHVDEVHGNGSHIELDDFNSDSKFQQNEDDSKITDRINEEQILVRNDDINKSFGDANNTEILDSNKVEKEINEDLNLGNDKNEISEVRKDTASLGIEMVVEANENLDNEENVVERDDLQTNSQSESIDAVPTETDKDMSRKYLRGISETMEQNEENVSQKYAVVNLRKKVPNSAQISSQDRDTNNEDELQSENIEKMFELNGATNTTHRNVVLDRELPVYENEVFIENVKKEKPDMNVQVPTPKEENVSKPEQVYPKPNPRTKKTKYGTTKAPYSNLVHERKDTNDHLPNPNETITFAEKEKHEQNVHEKIQTDNLRAGNVPAKAPRSFGATTNQVRNTGNANRAVGGSNENPEPIYWEIGDGPPVPKVAPRKRKEKELKDVQSGNVPDLSKGSPNLPDWIQQRPPIPSPRIKKPKSTQSLVQVSSSSSPKKDLGTANVFGSCMTNLNFEEPKNKTESNWSGEDFYSGKAASIAYGVTTRVRLDPPAPPLPQRMKKPSLTSLPGSILSEEEMVQKNVQPLQGAKGPPKDMTQKRMRRRTVPALPPKLTPRALPKLPSNPLQVLEINLRYFMDIITAIGGRTISTKPEDLLADVLFSINSIMGVEVGGTWTVIPPTEGDEVTCVTLGQVRSHLKEAFQLSQETFDEILSKVQKRETANVTLTLRIVEASDLRPKTVRGGSNAYVTISIPGTTETHRTRAQHETLFPKWKQEFKLKVKNLNKDIVKLDVWHDFDSDVSHQVLAVKDLKSLSRLVKGTNALAHKQEAHLLGSVSLPLKNIRERGLREWFPLFKESHKEEEKTRGFLHVEASVTSTSQTFSPDEARRSHDSLLARLVFHHLKTISNNNAEETTFQVPWHGKLTPEASAAIAQHSIILGLSLASQHLSWWVVGSRVPSADARWQMALLKAVQKSLSEGSYDVSDIETLADSFAFWIDLTLARLRNLQRSFPHSSAVIAISQFSTILSMFNLLESHKQSCSLLERKEIKDLKQEVRKAVIQHMEVWWTDLIEEHLTGEMRPEVQIQKIMVITSEAFKFLANVAAFYSPTLLKEMSIPYFRETFLMITKKINPCVRPPLMNIYNHLPDVASMPLTDSEEDKNTPTYTLEDGTSLWQLYVNLGKIHKLGSGLPLDVRKESGIHDYHMWFNRGVRRWVELARCRALAMIEKAVNFDNFEPVDEYCNFSSSATDVSGIFQDVQIWWKNLEWPDPENSMILMSRILEDVCSYGMRYADLLKQKVETLLSEENKTDQLVISKQICTGLNNIERIRDELTKLPELFKVHTLIENLKNSQTGGEEVSARFQTNIDKLIESSSESMEGKVFEFIEAVIQKMSGTLHHAVVQACEDSNEKPLLLETLDPALNLLRNKMSDSNFKRFLQIMWEQLIALFQHTVTKNTDKRKSSFFQGIYSILEASLEFFCPASGGLEEEEARTQEFMDLMELLECLRLSSENLISRYYSERYEEQKLFSIQSNGELVVRAFFTKIGKLTIEVIQAKDMQVHNELGSVASKQIQSGNQVHQIDPYVKVQLVPAEWFPHLHDARTKTLRKCDPAVFDETFDFDLRQDDNGVSSGFLLFTLKDYNLCRPNTYIGEAVIPMGDLPCVDSSCVHTVTNTYLKTTHPGIEFGYSSLRALKLRPNDRVASGFLKKIHSRLADSRARGGGCGALSSDEEKPRTKSPRILQKIGLS